MTDRETKNPRYGDATPEAVAKVLLQPRPKIPPRKRPLRDQLSVEQAAPD